MEFVQAPYRVATSRAAKKTYLGTFLFVYASLVLLAIAALAYPVFYYNYVPKKLIAFPIHLQYNDGPDPYGVVHLPTDLMLEQAYDISVELTVPRSPTNLQRGNFMVALHAMKTALKNPAFSPSSHPENAHEDAAWDDNVVFSSRRPALIPYEDPLVLTASRIFFLLYHIVFSHHAETVTLTVPMGELVEFNDVLPRSFWVHVQAGQALQVYSSTVTLIARLSGVRWFMYNHRIMSFLVCTTIFWLGEMVSMGLVWLTLGWFWSDQREGTKVKTEGNKEPRTPAETTEYEAGSAVKGDDDVKLEESDTELRRGIVGDVPHHVGDADDEGDSEGGWKESGPSSGFHSGRGGRLRRRSSWGGEGGA